MVAPCPTADLYRKPRFFYRWLSICRKMAIFWTWVPARQQI